MHTRGLIYTVRWERYDILHERIFLTPECAIKFLSARYVHPILCDTLESFIDGNEPGLHTFDDLKSIRKYYNTYIFKEGGVTRIYLYEKQEIIDFINKNCKNKKDISFYKNILQLDGLFFENEILKVKSELSCKDLQIEYWIHAEESIDYYYVHADYPYKYKAVVPKHQILGFNKPTKQCEIFGDCVDYLKLKIMDKLVRCRGRNRYCNTDLIIPIFTMNVNNEYIDHMKLFYDFKERKLCST